MHATLQLRTWTPLLEPDGPTLHALPQLVEAPHPNILERMLQARVQIRQELLHRALILHVSAHTLSHLDRR